MLTVEGGVVPKLESVRGCINMTGPTSQCFKHLYSRVTSNGGPLCRKPHVAPSPPRLARFSAKLSGVLLHLNMSQYYCTIWLSYF